MKNLKTQVNEVLTAIMAIEDQELQEMYNDVVHEMLEGCSEYVGIVVSQEQRLQVARFRMEASDFREFVMSVDSSRRFAHNALMDQVNLCNRVCEKIGVSAIAPDVTESDRETYGAFAMRVVEEYYDGNSEKA